MPKTLTRFFMLLALPLLFASCSELVRVQKSTDVSLKYSYAKNLFNKKKYLQAADLLEDVVVAYNGTSEGAPSLFLLADCYFMGKREISAADYFRRYYTTYPGDERAEEARFKAGTGLYKASPDPRLDQSATYEAIHDLQQYIEFYPDSPRTEEAKKMLFELQDKLAYKEYLSAKLYYNLGLYRGNNFRSAIVVGSDALKKYPYTKHKEDLLFLVLQSTYEEAKNSITGKLQTRFRDVIDQYYAYINQFPNGKYLGKAKLIFDDVNKQISKE